jgi:hypothetical protein
MLSNQISTLWLAVVYVVSHEVNVSIQWSWPCDRRAKMSLGAGWLKSSRGLGSLHPMVDHALATSSTKGLSPCYPTVQWRFRMLAVDPEAVGP